MSVSLSLAFSVQRRVGDSELASLTIVHALRFRFSLFYLLFYCGSPPLQSNGTGTRGLRTTKPSFVPSWRRRCFLLSRADASSSSLSPIRTPASTSSNPSEDLLFLPWSTVDPIVSSNLFRKRGERADQPDSDKATRLLLFFPFPLPVFKHKAYCHPADQTTTTVYDTATLLNEASSPKTLVSLGGDSAAPLPTLTTTPVGSSSATASNSAKATSHAASSEVASASASPSPSSASATVQNLVASASAQTTTVDTHAAVPTTLALSPTTSESTQEAVAPITTTSAAEEALPKNVSPTTKVNSGAVVVQSPATADIAAVCKTQKAVNAAAAATVRFHSSSYRLLPFENSRPDSHSLLSPSFPLSQVTINKTVTITATASPLATTTVIEKVCVLEFSPSPVSLSFVASIPNSPLCFVFFPRHCRYVFMEAISTSTTEISTATAVKRRHVSGSGARRL